MGRKFRLHDKKQKYASVQGRKGFSIAEQNKMMLSAETRLDFSLHVLQYYNYKDFDCLMCTVFLSMVKSFIDLVRYLFTLSGVKTFLSEQVFQDPLENYLGLQIQRGRASENRNVQEFCTQALRVINGVCLDTFKGNCRGNKVKRRMTEADTEKESQPLRKEKRTGRDINLYVSLYCYYCTFTLFLAAIHNHWIKMYMYQNRYAVPPEPPARC